MRFILLWFLLIPSLAVFPQKEPDNIPELTAWIIADATTQGEQITAIYKWITENIEYDYDALTSGKCLTFEGASDVVKNRKALCFGYVQLLGGMLDEIGIPWEEVNGYTNAPIRYFDAKLYVDDHSWIAIKLNDAWHMLDPTWDAGYIGAIPKTEKEPNIEKQQRRIERLAAKNVKRESKGKELLEIPSIDSVAETIYSDKIGFVQRPSTTWFLVPRDTFLTRHLPANPMWQQRDPLVPLALFHEGPNAVRAFVAKNPAIESPLYQQNIEEFREIDFLERLIKGGEMSYNFAPSNPRTKALTYYRYLEILNVKEVKKHFKSLPDVYQRSVYRRMRVIADTVMKYAEICEDFEKKRYKIVATAAKNGYRNAQRSAVKYESFAEKGQALNMRALSKVASRQEAMIREIEKLEKVSPSGNDKESTETLDFTAIPNIHKTIKQWTDSADNLMIRYKTAYENTVLQPIINELEQSKFLLAARRDILYQKELQAYAYIDSIDASLLQSTDQLRQLYGDTLPNELFPRELHKVIIEMSKTIEKVPELMSSKVGDAAAYMAYYNQKLTSYLSDALELAQYAVEHQSWMYGYLEQFEELWRQYDKLCRGHERFGDKANDHIVEFEALNNLRESDLLETVYDNAEKWQKKIGGSR